MDEIRSPLVPRRASVGANFTVICGITIGRSAFVGAGSVVTKDLPGFATVVGVPTRIVGWVCGCVARLKFSKDQARCSVCSMDYWRIY